MGLFFFCLKKSKLVYSCLSQGEFMTRNLKNILYPYLFVLKEGSDIKDNLMSYSVSMIQVGGPLEMLKSPKKSKNAPVPSEPDLLSAAFATSLKIP